jgi:Fe2+ or Zn2+ uptake regulation protein
MKQLKNSDENREAIAGSGLKVTKARLKVLELFRSSRRPMSATEVAKQMPGGLADQATVFRIVQSFVAKGLLKEVNLRHGHADYEIADGEDHHHLVCLKCGLVEDFSGCEAEKMMKGILKRCPSFKTVREHAFEFFGVCKACAS